MISLFIDTSKTSLSLGLMSGNKLIFKENTESYNKHSNYLINKIVNALKRNNLEIKDIDNFIILNGPGSFTGIRIGVTVMKTLAWSLNKKLYMLSNLKALELHSKENVDIKLSIIDDKKDSFYMGIYSDNEKEEYISLDDIPKYKNKKIELRADPTDDDVIAVIKKEIKSLNETLLFLEKANKTDEIEIETQKKEILQSNLPAMLSREQTEELIIQTIEKQ